MTRVIDEMPTLTEVEQATAEQIVDWHLHLRPTMMNAELDIVKAITQRYDRLPSSGREMLTAKLRRQHGNQ